MRASVGEGQGEAARPRQSTDGVSRHSVQLYRVKIILCTALAAL